MTVLSGQIEGLEGSLVIAGVPLVKTLAVVQSCMQVDSLCMCLFVALIMFLFAHA